MRSISAGSVVERNNSRCAQPVCLFLRTTGTCPNAPALYVLLLSNGFGFIWWRQKGASLIFKRPAQVKMGQYRQTEWWSGRRKNPGTRPRVYRTSRLRTLRCSVVAVQLPTQGEAECDRLRVPDTVLVGQPHEPPHDDGAKCSLECRSQPGIRTRSCSKSRTVLNLTLAMEEADLASRDCRVTQQRPLDCTRGFT